MTVLYSSSLTPSQDGERESSSSQAPSQDGGRESSSSQTTSQDGEREQAITSIKPALNFPDTALAGSHTVEMGHKLFCRSKNSFYSYIMSVDSRGESCIVKNTLN